MIPISQMVMKTGLALTKCKIGDIVIIQTYKKDRWIEIMKCEEGYEVRERGYEHNIYTNINEEALKKLLKELKSREFPRSNQVWFKVKKTK